MGGLEVPIGERFGRLVVAGEAEPAIHPSGAKRRMTCRCDCGNIITAQLSNLTTGNTTSCGCYRREKAAASFTTHGRTVQHKYPPNYLLWVRIKRRTMTGSASSRDRKNYLGRGIGFYGPWQKNFVMFDAWLNEHLGPCPKGQSLDRINNNGNYEPGNLKWSTPPEQGNNRRTNVWVEYEGETKTVQQWAEFLGMNDGTLRNRLFKAKWPVEKAFTTPVRWY